ncbi:sensor domain-containing diguanylate cyclase [Bradyrhizobium sp. ARR65]|uniref:sensor domain-containing diguanylate cyclase n=1 Tax=Bradyrhizobium sp. ARR65 TaxID=1040989 RepID=UPI0032DF80FF
MANKDYLTAEQAATNLVATITSEIERNIELYNLSLQAVVDGVKLPEIDTIRPELRQVVLFDRAATAKDLGSILVLDAAGNLTLDSRTLTPRKANFADHDFFRVHQARRDVGLFISAPWVTGEGEYLISLSRRIENADGSFGGVVAGSMRLSYFHDLFRKLKFGPEDSMTLFNTEGMILMRAPFDVDQIGQSISRSQVFRYFPQQQSGSYTTTSILDHVKRLFVFRQIGSHPLLLAEGLSLDGIYADWWREVWSISLVVAALFVFMIVLTIYLIAALKRRAAVENQLAVLANTDGLTGLCNRRRFDEALEAEWRRSQRSGTPIALLMIDADHFKAYNDQHGHQAGDAALTAIAGCIAGATNRASDLAARYGGEEFAVLVPGVNAEGAFELAEKIRGRLAALRRTQRERQEVCPTISIGLACLIPRSGDGPGDLVREADEALYSAKRDGRDRAVMASSSSKQRRKVAA